MFALVTALLLLPAVPSDLDLGQLRELLYDRLDPRGQSQAALLLVQSKDPAAEKIIRQGLRQTENEEAFQALAAAVRLKQDARFLGEMVSALVANRPRIRQAVAETLAVLSTPEVVRRLDGVARDARSDLRVRQTALWALGRTGRKQAVEVLLAHLDGPEEIKRVAAGALIDLTGQTHGTDAARWKEWWDRHKEMSAEQWLEMRLAYQTSRSLRLEGDLLRSRAQVIRLHQMLYARLPLAERFAYLQSLREHEDAGVRALSVVFAVELLPAITDPPKVRVLCDIVVRMTHDSNPDVQRGAVLALGRFSEAEAFERLRDLLGSESVQVRAAATRALAVQARGTSPEVRARQKQVVPLLQKALDDKALEVVVEAAEALGAMGAPEAGPVLTNLLRHRSEHVRQTAAQALERMADGSLIEGLLAGLNDVAVSVRFSLVGALGKAMGGGPIREEIRQRLLARLEAVLSKDEDAGVRGRAATVLGECGGVDQLRPLWECVLTGTEGRVQEKAWDAMVEVLTRSASLKLLDDWDGTLTKAKQGPRRVQLWAKVFAKWDQRPEQRELATAALEGLVRAYTDEGKWQAAGAKSQALLTRGVEAGDATLQRCLKLLLRVAELALVDGNRAEAIRIAQEVKPHLAPGPVAEAFDELRKKAANRE